MLVILALAATFLAICLVSFGVTRVHLSLTRPAETPAALAIFQVHRLVRSTRAYRAATGPPGKVDDYTARMILSGALVGEAIATDPAGQPVLLSPFGTRVVVATRVSAPASADAFEIALDLSADACRRLIPFVPGSGHGVAGDGIAYVRLSDPGAAPDTVAATEAIHAEWGYADVVDYVGLDFSGAADACGAGAGGPKGMRHVAIGFRWQP
jgi:hypothetical protein